MTGDRKKAEETYKKLLADDRTRFVGIRGIMKQKPPTATPDTALKPPKKGLRWSRSMKRPGCSPESSSRQSRLEKARARPSARSFATALWPRDVHRRRDAVLALSEGRATSSRRRDDRAARGGDRGQQLLPDLVPAAVMAADQYIGDGKPRYAARILRRPGRPRRTPISRPPSRA